MIVIKTITIIITILRGSDSLLRWSTSCSVPLGSAGICRREVFAGLEEWPVNAVLGGVS